MSGEENLVGQNFCYDFLWTLIAIHFQRCSPELLEVLSVGEIKE